MKQVVERYHKSEKEMQEKMGCEMLETGNLTLERGKRKCRMTDGRKLPAKRLCTRQRG